MSNPGPRPSRTRCLWPAAWVAALLLLGGDLSKGAGPSIELQLVASNIASLTDIQHAGDGTGRLFLAQQSGQIRVYSGGQVLATPFLNLSGTVYFSGEQGLLGLAFHPQYSTNGVFFVHYTSSAHTDPNAVSSTVIARYRVSTSNPNVADPSGQILLTYDQPYTNHKGGQIRFGPDGYLYIALGDGGSGGDPLNNGQRLDTLLGKLLRIDVNNLSSSTYAIPASNPFVGTGSRPEIWAYGLRNPWRFSFDRQTGDLFIADVGQGSYEEVDYQAAGDAGGQNYGWRRMEGLHCNENPPTCNVGTLPVIEYSHTFGCSITGGFRYRGASVSSLVGNYLFTDYCSGRIWGATPDANGVWSATQLIDTTLLITTFGEDESGEIYVGDGGGGRLYRIVAAAASQPTLTVARSGLGTGRVTSSPVAIDCGSLCGAVLASGTQVTLTATADAGSTFVQWTGDADCSDSVVSLDADRTCTARFGTAFTDDTLTVGSTAIKAVHITELRARIDALRLARGLSAFSWTDSTLSVGATAPRAVHVTDLRTALSQAYAAAGRAAPVYSTPDPATGGAIRGVHITELRLAVHLLEG